MKQFGFAPLERKSVNIYETDKSLWQQLSGENPEFKGCLSCGACAAACPINAETRNLSVRRSIIEMNRGIEPTSVAELCQMCNRCALVCPKGLNTRKIFFELIKRQQNKSL